MAELPDNAVVCMTAYTAMQLSGDAAAPFSQEANFWYITGIDEPDWRVVITRQRSWLVAPDMSATQRVFEGGLVEDDARMRSGVDEVVGSGDERSVLSQLSGEGYVAYTLGKDPYEKYFSFTLNPAINQLERRLKRLFQDVQSVRLQMSRLRAIKQPEELSAIREAIALTVDAFSHAKQDIPALSREYELEAVFTAHFRRHNGHHAYDPIVASGKNACTLHYAKNDTAWQQPSLVLIDIGARTMGYAADITRTYALGQPTERQVAVYRRVREAHVAIINLLKPGLTLLQYQDASDDIMRQALRSLGILKEKHDYRRYFPHAISHGLGIDVHDSLGGYETLRPGMVLTVEPGIYIPEEGIGVRLEDDILITEASHENLSEALSLDL